MIEEGSLWTNANWRSSPRVVVVLAVVGERVRFRFQDSGTESNCSDTAFRRTYKPLEVQL